MSFKMNPLKTMMAAEQLAVSLLRREVSKEKIALKKATKSFSEYQADIRRLREEIRDHEAAKPKAIRYVPLIGKSVQEKHASTGAELHKSRREKVNGLKKLRNKDAHRRAKLESYKEHVAWLHTRVAFMKENPALADTELERLAHRLWARLDHISKSPGFRKGDEVISVLRDERGAIEAWHDDAEARLAKVWAPRRREPSQSISEAASHAFDLGTRSEPRIYLPMNRLHGNKMRSHGFRIDESVKKGSQIYFDPTRDMDLVKKWQGALPTGARRVKTKYSFLEIADKAWRQNVRKAFKPDYWEMIRFDLNLMSGNRCMICGNRGGRLITDYFKGEGHKSDSVECHEVWEWQILDEERGIGVQRLKEILVVCNDCHMMFHEELAIEKAVNNGKNGAEVREFLRNRMAVVTDQTLPEIDHQLASEKAELAKFDQIEHWIMDLQYLSDHQYMTKTTPEFNDGSDNPVRPSMIAGTDFLEADGDLVQAREVDQLYHELMAELESEMSVGMKGA